jgi:hypothetical protein
VVKPLLHFAVPFAFFRALGLNRKTAFLVAIVALMPDLDVLIHIHRSFTHSYGLFTAGIYG